MANYNLSQYVPSFIKAAAAADNRLYTLKFADIQDSNIESDDSFAYRVEGVGLKSTQQLNVDWTKFENHTFFMSAEAKVNLAFEQIINNYPFDGTRKEVEDFFTNLTGYEKWVFESFPKFRGQLHFSGTQLTETTPDKGTYIIVKDIPGALFPNLGQNSSSKTSVLNPKDGKSLSIEFQLYVPTITTPGTQILLQKLNPDKNHGFCARLNSSVSTSVAELYFDVFAGVSSMSADCFIQKGKFNHICLVWDNDVRIPELKIYVNEELAATSRSRAFFSNLGIDYADLLIGSGSQYSLGSSVVTPQQTLSGTLDELRIFHNVRSISQQQSYAKKSIYSTDDLKLYYKFNEPPPPLSPFSNDLVNSIVLDSSGNSLHAYVVNFSNELRQDASLDSSSNMTYEKEIMCPVLFPAYPSVVSLNLDLLEEAKEYDEANPNLITKLIPRHYLLEGASQDGLTSAEQNNGSQYGGTGIPGQGQLNNVQLMLSLLYIWAKFFDEMRLFMDAFANLRNVDYDSNESTPNNFLFDIAKSYGFYLPPLFNNSTIDQYVEGEDIDPLVKSNEAQSLKSVQHELLRRILINLPTVIKSKGTQHSIKSFLRAIGIDPDNSMRFREYGGPTYKQSISAREQKTDLTTMVTFTTSSFVMSPYLSASRVELGYPYPRGTFVQKNSPLYGIHGVSNNINDGLLTSGSWTFESIIKYNLESIPLQSITQSLVRMCTTGSSAFGATPGVIANLVAFYDDDNPKLSLFLRPDAVTALGPSTFRLDLDLPTGAIFNGDLWNVSFGRVRNDDIESKISSSYYLRAGTQIDGEMVYYQATSSYFDDNFGGIFRAINSNVNSSGSFLAFGTNQAIPAASTYYFLNNTTVAPSAARATTFDGRMAKVRFWSKSFTIPEWIEHVRNYQSLGVSDPLTNYNYEKVATGSFERLRLDSMSKQTTRRADSDGKITFLDFSENGMHLTGSGFATDRNTLLPEIIRYSYLSPYFDEAISNEKVRVRGYESDDLLDRNPWSSRSPVYEIVRSEAPTDDVRFSIDFSLVDSLNRDIITMFSTFEALENMLGSPELVYSPDYPSLDRLRNIYFNRLKEKLNFKAFFEFYSWFDNSINIFIEQLIPRKTVYNGTNFVVESHMLERSKLEYLSTDIYLGEATRNNTMGGFSNV